MEEEYLIQLAERAKQAEGIEFIVKKDSLAAYKAKNRTLPAQDFATSPGLELIVTLNQENANPEEIAEILRHNSLKAHLEKLKKGDQDTLLFETTAGRIIYMEIHNASALEKYLKLEKGLRVGSFGYDLPNAFEVYGFDGQPKALEVNFDRARGFGEVPVLCNAAYHGKFRSSLLVPPAVIYEQNQGVVEKKRAITQSVVIERLLREKGDKEEDGDLDIDPGIALNFLLNTMTPYHRGNALKTGELKQRIEDYIKGKVNETRMGKISYKQIFGCSPLKAGLM